MQEKSKKNTGIKEKLLYFVETQGITKEDFYRKIDIDGANFRGKNKKSELSTDKIVNILRQYPEISPDWLLLNEGDMLRKMEIDDIAHVSNKGLPLIPIEAIAGLPSVDNIGVLFENCEHYLIPEFEKIGVDYMIRVSGSSMYPKYSNGDILACRFVKDVLFFQWGKIYVIDSSQGALVKRVFQDENNPDNLILVSDNREHYPPFSFPKADIRSLSIVIGVVRLE